MTNADPAPKPSLLAPQRQQQYNALTQASLPAPAPVRVPCSGAALIATSARRAASRAPRLERTVFTGLQAAIYG